MLEWLHLCPLGPGTYLLEMSARVPANEVFTSPALILDDIREAMDALCLEVEEEPPPSTTWKENCTRSCCSIGGCRHSRWVTATRTPGEVSRVVAGAPGSGSMVGPSGPSP